ncbi:hypothetical protein Q4575_10640 [Psychrosphaera sp. 1_MG-2023]|uniref:hypothetical protein n=1 Tax=Psychrosphaera sp. 1_MG-2023 TaxID=3062643 RepID=UPI0026E1352D|nr:hypothetical protein [Psychrosphaera sp. 1_MG-2023]MDO6719862.1 hypothetical protein [Psychrosphaera sp. 1_MG-2023]
MNSFYLYKTNVSSQHQNVLVCYVASLGFDFHKFSEVIKRAVQDSPFSRELVIISAEYNKAEIDDKLINKSEAIVKLKNNINNYQILNIHLGLIGRDGEVLFNENIDPLCGTKFSLKQYFPKLIEQGFINIIKNRNLVMESSANYHFVKPSGKHTNRFIKASNVMEKGAEISFIAINLLLLVKNKIDKIFTDTAGIFPVAYELLTILRRFGSDECCGFIDSFGGYKGLNEYRFSGSENSLVLISASTSDDLANELRNKVGLKQAKILSLFSSNADADKDSTLVSFKHYFDQTGDDIFTDFTSHHGHSCELCIYEKSIPLSLSNSQFVFEAPKTELYLPVATDSNKQLKDLIYNYKDDEVFKCLFDGLKGQTEPVPEYFIDVSKLVKTNAAFKEKIKNLVIRNFPLSADLIVHANDQGAEDVAKYIQSEVKSLGKRVSITDIHSINKHSPIGGIVVVAGSIQSGKSLLDISRMLRDFKTLPITYIVGFAKYNDPESYVKLQNDLKFNNGNPNLGRHQFIAVDEIMLPIKEHRVNAWDRELELLKNLEALPLKPCKSLELVKERDSQLRKATNKENEGLGKELFLMGAKGNHMALGPTFAFWSDKDNQNTFYHQATVYYTMSSILQSLRYKRVGKNTIPLGEGYILKQLNPLLFDRFNEGIIQASVLRSAKPRELDYSDDDASSAIVGSLILKMLNEPSEDTSEALPEFLLALCTEKLQIKTDHIRDFLNIIIDKGSFPLVWLLLEYTKSVLLGYVIPKEVESTGDTPF